MTDDELYKILGIGDERFNTVVKPLSDEIVRCSGKVDLALMKLDMTKKLTSIEKLYVAFCIGKLTATTQLRNGIYERLGF